MQKNSRLRLLSELAGAISIVLSLIFVGIELRQANNLSEADGLQSLNEMAASILIARMTDVELNRLIAKAYQSDELNEAHGFTAAEGSQLRGYFAAWTTYGESSWKYYERGIIALDQYQGSLSVICTIFSPSSAAIDLWRSLYGSIAHDFVADTEQNCAALMKSE